MEPNAQEIRGFGAYSNVHFIENFIDSEDLTRWQHYACSEEYSRGSFASHGESSGLYRFNDYVKKIEERASYVFGVPLERYDEDGLLNKWSVGDHLEGHVDAPTDFERFIGKGITYPPSVILYSSIIYINDDYEGGSIHFYGHDKYIRPTSGSLLLFPSTNMYPHEVMEVTSGTRYTLSLFLSNPGITNLFGRLFKMVEQQQDASN